MKNFEKWLHKFFFCFVKNKNVDECKNPPTTIPVAVTVYYEALNPISYNYFHQQLCPYYHVLDDIIELELIPFGNTIIIDDTNMITNSSSGKKRQDFSNRFQVIKFFQNSISIHWI